jgi:ABC-type Na+ transport system ATPase subunit NatA
MHFQTINSFATRPMTSIKNPNHEQSIYLVKRVAKYFFVYKYRIIISFIPRAILKNPSLLILDEATSALDTKSKAIVQKALENLMQGRSSIVIAHRLSTVIGADRIVVMDKGKIVDAGKHGELLRQCAIYANLYRIQFANEKNADLETGNPTSLTHWSRHQRLPVCVKKIACAIW